MAAGCAGVIGILIAVAVVVALVYVLVNIMVACGALYGAGVSLRNYGLAFHRNVRHERIPA
jgi:hypothetical protein